MAQTRGLNHLGLAVADLERTTNFFVEALGWSETARDPDYPRTTVTDGHLRLTLWQVNRDAPVTAFDHRANVGLHHLALEVDSMDRLMALAETLPQVPGVTIEFLPEPMGQGPRQHMMLSEPGGIRIELTWPGP